MSEAMTAETIVEAYWRLQGYWTKLRFPFQTQGRGWSDIDVLAYHPEKKIIVISESKVRGPKRDVYAYTNYSREKYGDIFKYDDSNYLGFLEQVKLICSDEVLFRKFYKAMIHCGKFKEETMVLDDRMIEGAIIEQIEEAMDFIRKNINVRFVMTGKPAREEVWDYPLEALREAVINAVCHRDYTGPSNTEVRIYDNELIVWNPGGLPLGLTVEDLYKPHPSILRNKGIGGIFYDMGLVEQWGSGIDKMRGACIKAGIPEPKFEEHHGFRVVFRKDIYTEEYLQKIGLNERQIKAVIYVKEKGKISNKEYQGVCNISERTATRDLSNLVSLGLFMQIGVTGKGTEYILTRHKDAKDATKTP